MKFFARDSYFTLEGRLGRIEYLLAGLMLGLIFCIITLIWLVVCLGGGLKLEMFSLRFFLLIWSKEPSRAILAYAPLVVVLAIFWVAAVSLEVRRWHDLGRTGWMCLISISSNLISNIPKTGVVDANNSHPFLAILELLCVLALLYVLTMLWFLPGDYGTNKYGKAPTWPHNDKQPMQPAP
jgi:uncharacterized membrane protein YhaH (DUF805 family)